jgi:integrase
MPGAARLRPYDLRHAALSLWLASGAPPAEVAARAGHSVCVLVTIYCGCRKPVPPGRMLCWPLVTRLRVGHM